MASPSSSSPWWHSSSDDDPITLEPISMLPYEPFALPFSATLFDPLALSHYLVSRSKFECPLTRSPLTFEVCQSLDSHLDKHVSSSSHAASSHVASSTMKYRVTEAFRLFAAVKVSSSSDDQDRIEALQGAAAMALQGLFTYGTWREGAVQGSVMHGLRIIDDDEAVAEASDRWRRENAVGSVVAMDEDERELFPQLSEALAAKVEVLGGMKEVVEKAAEAHAEEERLRKAALRKQRVEEARLRRERAAAREQLKRSAELRIAEVTKEEEERRRMVEDAREEIERWRAAMFREAEEKEEARKPPPQPKPPPPPLLPPQGQAEVVPPPEPEVSKEERDRAKRAAKKKREREKQKEKKKKGREKKEFEEKERLVLEAKKVAQLRCNNCGEGIVLKSDVFSREDRTFCSTKCSRSYFS